MTVIRNMTPADLDFAASCTAAEGWVSEGRQEFEGFFSLPGEGAPLRVSLGILEANQAAVSLVRSLGFVERADSPWRMRLGRPGNLGDAPLAFAVGTAAKG